MKPSSFPPSGVARAVTLLCFSLALLSLSGSLAQPQSQSQAQPQTQSQAQAQPQSGSTTAPAAPADDAAAKAAERKRKFDEQRKLMEGGYSPSKEESRAKGDPDLRIMPADVNLLVGDRVIFHVYDKGQEIQGNSWSAMPGRILGSWFQKGMLVIEAKSPGTAGVGVEYNRRYAHVVVTVYPGDKMPKGVERSSEVIKPAGSN